MNVSRLKTIVKWVVVTDLLAAVIGIVTLPWRSEIVAATAAAGIPQPTPAETVVLAVCTVALFYLWVGMLELDSREVA